MKSFIMKIRTSLALIMCMVIFRSCTKDRLGTRQLQSNGTFETASVIQSHQTADRITGVFQISGTGYLATPDECDAASVGATYALKLTGDLEGCHYIFIDSYECSPSGTYRESGREYFVVTYKGQSGSFWTTYHFQAKYEGCAIDGAPLGAEIFGRCQHPITVGSGQGAFEGVTGRLDFVDNITTGDYPYTGHLDL